MPNAKFWLIQFLTVAFLTVVLGSPVMAHGRGYKSYKSSHNYWKRKTLTPEQRDERFHNKMERSISKQEKRIQWYGNVIERLSKYDNNRRYVKYRIKRFERGKAYAVKKLAFYQGVLDKHNAENHKDDGGGDDDTGGVDPVAAAQAKCTELFGAVASLNTSSLVCTNLITFESVQL